MAGTGTLRGFAAPFLIVLATVVCFWPALSNEFVNWDDFSLLTMNSSFRGFSLSHLKWMFTTFHMGHYMPLSWLSYALDHAIWGMNSLGFHATNVLLHALNAVLVYFLTLRLLAAARPHKGSEPSWALPLAGAWAALFFSIHPLRVESVAWATERRDVLSAFLFLAAVLAYIRYCRDRARPWYAVVLALFILSLLAKAIGIVFPLMLLLLDIYPLRRWHRERKITPLLWEKAPFVVLALAFMPLAMMAQVSSQAALSFYSHGFFQRLAQASFSVVFYLRQMIWPTDLSPLYEFLHRINMFSVQLMASVCLAALLTILAFTLFRRLPGVWTAWLAYLALLAPTSGIFQSGSQFAADRYTYLALLPFCFWMAAGLRAVVCERKPSAVAGIVIFIFVLPLLAWQTRRQLLVWRNTESLQQRVLSLDPHNVTFRSIRAYTAAYRREWHRAVAEWSMIEENPPRYMVKAGLGYAYFKLGSFKEALFYAGQAAILSPNRTGSQELLGIILLQSGRPAEALTRFDWILRLAPNNNDALQNRGSALYQMGRYQEALDSFVNAYQVRPDSAKIVYNMGLCLVKLNRRAEAAGCFRQVRRLDPAFKPERWMLGRGEKP